MSEKDLNDRAREGSLPADPAQESERAQRPRLHVVSSDVVRDESAAPDAERAIIAALLWAATYEPAACKPVLVTDIVGDDAFSDVRLGGALRAIAQIRTDGQLPDAVSVNSFLVRNGLPYVGAAALEQMVSAAVAPTDTLLVQWAGLVRSAWLRRRMVQAGQAMAQSAKSGDLSQALAAAESVATIAHASSESSRPVTVFAAFNGSLKSSLDPNREVGSTTGIRAVDYALGNLIPQHYTIVGAASGHGKTAFGLTIAGNVARQGGGVLYLSTEMDEQELALRLACSWASVSATDVMRQRLTPEARARLIGVMPHVKAAPLRILRDVALTTRQVESLTRRAKTELAEADVKLRLVVVDYIQNVTAESDEKNITEERMLRSVSKHLKAVAIRNDVHLMALAQTIPIVGDKHTVGDGKPDDKHLAGCKAMKNWVENLAFIHRTKVDGKYPRRGPASFVIRKSRWGFIGEVPLLFDGPLMRFEDNPDEPFEEY